jgi:hypothetical protein
MAVTSSQVQNISSPSGNSLAVFVDGITGILLLKDINGKTEPLSNYVCGGGGGGSSPFEYNANATGIEPILGTNDASGYYSTIGGGKENTASSCYGTISGGVCNTASDISTTIGGGRYNVASAQYAIIGGGRCNNASGQYAVIGGGRSNIASCEFSAVAGGICNTASGRNSAIGGGCCNTASNRYATIGGGCCNTANGCFSSILGGQCNNTCGFANSHIIGSNICATQVCTTFMNCASADNLTVGCFVCVGTNKVLVNTAPPSGGGIIILGAGTGSTVRCGLSNTTSGACSTVSGGTLNTASGLTSTVGGGLGNNASGFVATIGGGFCNTASCNNATVGGGRGNIASFCYATIGGGCFNTASNYNATVGGGYKNTASGACSSILGGQCNNTCGFANSHIVGSNICATQVCTTFMNCASVQNLTVGCMVCVGANKVLENLPTSTPRLNVVSKNVNYTFVLADDVIEATTAGIILTLPTSVGLNGKTFIAKNTSGGTITIDTTSSQTIDGNLTQLVNTFDSITMISNNVNWLII